MLSDTKKLAVLRSRTDHDLLVLVKRELDRGFALLEVATDSGSVCPSRESVCPSHAVVAQDFWLESG